MTIINCNRGRQQKYENWINISFFVVNCIKLNWIILEFLCTNKRSSVCKLHKANVFNYFGFQRSLRCWLVFPPCCFHISFSFRWFQRYRMANSKSNATFLMVVKIEIKYSWYGLYIVLGFRLMFSLPFSMEHLTLNAQRCDFVLLLGWILYGVEIGWASCVLYTTHSCFGCTLPMGIATTCKLTCHIDLKLT